MAFFNKLFGGKSIPAKETPVVSDVKSMSDPNVKKKTPPCDAWLLLKSDTKEAVIEALQMYDVTPCAWEEGCSYSSSDGSSVQMFVTESINGFCIVIGKGLPDLAYRVKALSWIVELSAVFSEAYSFAAQDRVQVYGFAMAKGGKMVRSYAVAQGSVRLNKGERSVAEVDLGYTFPIDDDQLFELDGFMAPSVDAICAISKKCGINPVEAIGTKGILGKVQKI